MTIRLGTQRDHQAAQQEQPQRDRGAYNRQRGTLRHGLIIALLLVLPASVFAQATLVPFVPQTFVDANGNPLSGGKLCTYAAGTTTPQVTYSSDVVSVPTQNSNPVIMAANGRPTSGGIFLSPTSYKFVLRSAGTTTDCTTGTILWTLDNITAIPTTSGAVDVPATAGETITAGQVAYLSDGSGGLTAGRWYKADAANTYSSTVPQVGIAPSTIASGTTGTMRLVGQVTGLAGLVTGAPYYIGTAGALTATAPGNARNLGAADTTTSLVLAGNPPPTTTLDNGVDDFRLTLSTGVPVTTANVTAAGTLYLAPYKGNRITLFDASGNASLYTSAQISIAVPAATNQMYDVFAYASSGAVTLELLAWTNDTTRATAIVNTVAVGVYTKSGDATRRYLGSMRTTGVANQTEDSLTKRLLCNYYNPVPRALRVIEATDSWTYTTNTYRQANNSGANQVAVVNCLAEKPLTLNLVAYAAHDVGAPDEFAVSIGEDSTTTPSTSVTGGYGSIGLATQTTPIFATLQLVPAVGYHTYVWLEKSITVGNTTTWYGDNGGASQLQSGMTGWILG